MHFNIRERVKNLSQPGEGLYQRTVRSGAWAFALRITERVFSIAKLIILARVLAPNDFGLLGIALLAMMTLETFSQTGFQQALIQKKENIKDYLDAAWTVSALRGLVLFAVLFFLAPYVAIFFNAPLATPIIRVIGLASLLQGLTNIGVIYFQKELEFNKQFIYRASGTLADFVVAVAAVLILRSVWALVFGLLAGNLVRLIVSYLVHTYRPHFKLDLAKTKELFGFGKWILGSSILIFLLTQGDDIFVGKLLGVTLLGFYQMAYRFSNAPATEITHVISQVTFPAYSKLQDNLPSLREAYLKVLQFTSFLSFPIAGLIFVLAPDFTMIFLGEKWMPMVPAMQALVLWGVIRALTGAISPVLMALGKPKIVTRLQLIQAILLFMLIYPLTEHWGILGTSLAVVFSALVLFFIRNHILIKTIACKIWGFYKLMLLPLALAVISTLPVIALKLFVMDSTNIYGFLLFIAIFVVTFGFLTYIADRFLNYGIRVIVKDSFKSLL